MPRFSYKISYYYIGSSFSLSRTLSIPNTTISNDGVSRPTIPQRLISYETLIYVGFTEAKASNIWQRWNSWGDDRGREVDDGPVTFESCIRAPIKSCRVDDTCSEDDEDWKRTMEALGISEETQRNMMMPCWRGMRLTQSCKFWLLDTFSARYTNLREILDSFGFHDLTATTTSDAPGVTMATMFSPAFTENAPDATVIYQAGPSTRFQGPLAEEIHEDGVQFRKMQRGGRGRGDFALGVAVYTVLDVSIARKYAGWAKRRYNGDPVSILRMEVADTGIESLESLGSVEETYWPSSEWKSLVWSCRLGKSLRHALAKFSKATLIIGNIPGKPTAAVENLTSLEQIEEKWVLEGDTDNGNKAVQYAFLGDEGIYFLEDHARRLRGFQCTQEDLLKIEAELGTHDGSDRS